MNKNILLVVRHPVGGIKSYLNYVYNSDHFNEFNITILIPYDESNTLADLFHSKNITIKYSSPSLTSLILNTALLIRSKKFAIIHSHGFTSGLCVSLATFLFPSKHIMTPHDVLHDKQFIGPLASIKKYIISVLFNKIDVIQSVSNDAKNNFQRMLHNVKKPEHIAILNGIKIENFINPDKRNFRHELNLDDSVFLIGFMGRFMSQKGFRDIISAIEILVKGNNSPKKPLLLAFGYGGFIREDKELIERKGLNDYFIFLPAVDNPAQSIKGLDILAVPSLWEACPLLPMECLVVGTPLIASNCIGLREIIRDTPTIEVEAGNPQSLASAIDNYRNNPDPNPFIKYKNTACQRFDSKITSKNILDLINRCIDA